MDDPVSMYTWTSLTELNGMLNEESMEFGKGCLVETVWRVGEGKIIVCIYEILKE